MDIKAFLAKQSELLGEPATKRAWLEYHSRFNHQRTYFRFAPEYKNQVPIIDGKRHGKDVNLFKLFTERCFQLMRHGGECGMVIPSGIYTDMGSKQLRLMLFDGSTISGLFCIENRLGVFEDVHRMFKFVVLTFRRGGFTNSFPAAFMRHEVAELDSFPSQGAIEIAVELVKRMCTDSFSVMEFKSPMAIAIAEKMLKFPLLGDEIPNAWTVELHREFNMTDDEPLFKERPAKTRLPLYEGKLIWHFDHQFSAPRYWIEESEGRSALLPSKRLALAKAKGTAGLNVPAENEIVLDYQRYRFAFRDIASSTNERSMISAILPPGVFTGNTLNNQQPVAFVVDGSRIDQRPMLTPLEMCFVAAVLNSLTVDWLIRQKITSHVNMFYVYQVPVPRLSEAEVAVTLIADRAARLTCTTPEYNGLASAVGLKPPTHRAAVTDPAARAKLRAELDAMVAHLYWLTEEEFAQILTAFPIGPETTKQAALDEFVRMRESGEAAVFNPDLAKPAAAVVDPAKAVKDLIAAGESALVEFKSSARWDVKNSKPEKFIERIIVKTVAALLNTQGGTLVIGVEDERKVYGLAEDYKLSGGKGPHRFERLL